MGQDAFRSETKIQKLDLTKNKIEILNANAFRGLEVKFKRKLKKVNFNKNNIVSLFFREAK